MFKRDNRHASRLIAHLLLIAIILGSTVAAGAGRANAPAKRRELKQLQARIKKIRQQLEAKMSRRGDLTRQLRKSERQIAQLSTTIKNTQADLADAQTQLKKLRAAKNQAQVALTREKSALKQSILASYMAGREERLKLLLNQENPARLGRLLIYYDYFSRARSQRIQSVRAHLTKLGRINTKIHHELDELTALAHTHQAALTKLKTVRTKRTRLLAEVNAEISRKGAKLSQMHRNEKALSQLLNSLRHTVDASSPNINPDTHFSKLKTKLAWPIQGHILAHFGAPMANGKLRRHGDLIGAPRGTPVHAISYGRVIYADWLAHFGLLVIINHGNDYMSLYGHNQSIFTRVGDTVKPGTIIAGLGESGGQSEPALYFEIRHGKTPLNPRLWCNGKLAEK